MTIPETFLCLLGYKLVATETNTSGRVFAGKVQFYADDGKWYYLHDSDWTKADQDVLCKDIGFPEAARKTDQHLKGENDSVVCKNYACSGKEPYLIKCIQSAVVTDVMRALSQALNANMKVS